MRGAREGREAQNRRTGVRSRAATLVLGTLVAFLASPASAQVVLDPTFSSDTVGAGDYAPGLSTDYLIRQSYGQTAGTNLFHQFTRFDIPTGQSATFVEDAAGSGIERIIARVNGTSASSIDGVLRSTIPGADLYFYNARGVVFGPNARLDLRGAFHAASADFLRFADDVRFGQTESGSAVTITSALPSAWGFLSPGAAGITVQSARLATPNGEDLTLVGGPIDIEGPGTSAVPNLAAPSAALRLVSVEGSGEVATDARSAPGFDILPATGPITLSNGALLDASGNGGQVLIVRARSLDVQNATIRADHRGASDHPGRAVDIAVTESLRFGDVAAGTTGSLFSFASRVSGGPAVGDGGEVVLAAESFDAQGDGSFLFVGAGCNGGLACGAVGDPEGDGGRFEIHADAVAVRDGAQIATVTAGTGRGGDLVVRARTLDVGTGPDVLAFTGLFSSTSDRFSTAAGFDPARDGRGGDLDIEARETLVLENAAVIESIASGTGRGGDVRVVTGDLRTIDTAADMPGPNLSANAALIHSRTSNAFLNNPENGEGRAGDVDVFATRSIDLVSGRIQSTADTASLGAPLPNGLPGAVRVQAPNGSIRVGDRGQISSIANEGIAPDLTIAADTLLLEEGGLVQTVVRTIGRAADQRITANDIRIRGANAGLFSAALETSAVGADGASGAILVDGGRFTLEDGAQIEVNSSREGAAGTVRLGATAPLESVLVRNAVISSQTLGRDATGGDIEIRANAIRLDQAGVVQTGNLAVGDTGSITLEGGALNLESGARIQATSGVDGTGGDITIRLREGLIARNSVIDTNSAGATPTNQGGNVDIQAQVVVLSETALRASAPAGAGGRIAITTERFLPAADNPAPDATGGTAARDGEVRIVSSETTTASAIPRANVVYDDPGRQLATRCDRRTDAQGSLFVLPRPMQAPPAALPSGETPRSPRALAWSLLRQAETALGRREEAEAKRLARKALPLAAAERDALAEFRIGRVLAEALQREGESEAALPVWRRTARIGEGLRRDAIQQGTAAETPTPTGREAPIVADARATTGRFLSALLDVVESEPKASSPRQQTLREVRDWLEVQRSAELEDHFGDACLASQAPPAPDAIEGALIVYPVLLEDRVALVTSFEGALTYHRAPIGTQEALDLARSMRRLLEKRTTRQYLRPAQALYDALIRPIAAEIRAEGVDTLVVVPDGPLRSIPFAALHDRETGRFLIDEKPVALVPSLRLTRPSRLARDELSILAAGLEKATAGFAPLAFTREEIFGLKDRFPTTRVLFGRDFGAARLEEEIRARPYSIVHVATHGRVAADGRESFLLTRDGTLGLEDVARMIQSTRFRAETPLELLTLSACETAAGDDEAALGLAGVALRAGARSALATLWPVNDEATAHLIDAFYTELARPEQTRAGALRTAQQKIRKTPRFAHPGYWAPFLMISGWL